MQLQSLKTSDLLTPDLTPDLAPYVMILCFILKINWMF